LPSQHSLAVTVVWAVVWAADINHLHQHLALHLHLRQHQPTPPAAATLTPPAQVQLVAQVDQVVALSAAMPQAAMQLVHLQQAVAPSK
jgi:hypothetical protein